jgi:hypothetical protein
MCHRGENLLQDAAIPVLHDGIDRYLRIDRQRGGSLHFGEPAAVDIERKPTPTYWWTPLVKRRILVSWSSG